MESVLIQSNFPHRISLSQASQITGYHQDYLGLLCRLGKIEASKIGRNWYTTQSELGKFMNPEMSPSKIDFTPEAEGLISESTTTLEDILSDNIPDRSEVKHRTVPTNVDSVVSTPQVARAKAPTIVENIVISELSAMPIRLVKKPAAAHHHTLQTLITRTKLDQLKQEVLEIAGFMDSVSSELAEHRSILRKHEAMLAARKDLTTNYASSIDFGINNQPTANTKVTMIEDKQDLDLQPNRFVWVWPSLVVGLFLVVSLVVLSKAMPQTVNYATTIYHELTEVQLTPQVAGESDITSLPVLEILE